MLGGQTIALGLMMAFLVVPASSLFLVEYGADKLPFVYLAVAGSGVAVSWAMARAGRVWSLSRLALTLLGSYAIVVASSWLLLVVADATWVTFVLLVTFPLSIPLGFVIVGAQAGRLLDLQQMKEYFPRVCAGFSVGFAIGGLLTAWLAKALGDVAHLLVLDVAVAALFIGLVVTTGQRNPAQLRSRPDPAPAPSHASRKAGGSGILRNRLVRLVFGYQLLSAAVTQFLDFMVWERAALRYPDADDLAAFLGYFGAIINIVSVAFVALIAGRLTQPVRDPPWARGQPPRRGRRACWLHHRRSHRRWHGEPGLLRAGMRRTSHGHRAHGRHDPDVHQRHLPSVAIGRPTAGADLG